MYRHWQLPCNYHVFQEFPVDGSNSCNTVLLQFKIPYQAACSKCIVIWAPFIDSRDTIRGGTVGLYLVLCICIFSIYATTYEEATTG